MDPVVQALVQKVDTLGKQAVQNTSGESRLELLHTVRKLAIELETEGEIVDRLAYQVRPTHSYLVFSTGIIADSSVTHSPLAMW